jgi:YHS domain-containing protein
MKLTRRTTLTLLAATAAMPAFAGEDPVYTEAGFAINGYDPVAYFKSGEPIAGSGDHAAEWNGAKWLFSNEENRSQFEESPEKYAPQYGGYCAYAVSRGYTASTDPDAWTIYDGKLYLNYNKAVRLLWSRDIPGHVASADGNWPDVLK